MLWEISTPFVHMRWFLYKIGRGSTRLYLANGLAMMVVFCLCRIVWGGCKFPRSSGFLLRDVGGGDVDLAMRYFISSTKPQDVISPITIWLLRAICVSLNGLNWYWFQQMVVIAFRLVFGSSKDKSNDSHGKPLSDGETNLDKTRNKVKST